MEEYDVEEREEEVNNKSSIRGTFRFHSVGQGLFYSGILNQNINRQHRVFTFVYDCGTSSSKAFLNREIDNFKLLLPKVDGKRHLDLLVISHLHDDHVNGLERLLSDVGVDTVVMSYVDDELRMLAQLESENDSEFLRQFYADPLDWLRQNGVRRVCLLGADERGYGKDSQNEGHRWVVDSRDIQIPPEEIWRIENTDDTEMVYLKHNVRLRATDYIWNFFFENLCVIPDIAMRYKHTVEEFEHDHLVTFEQILKSRRLTKELRKS